jgi:hypothetical protein
MSTVPFDPNAPKPRGRAKPVLRPAEDRLPPHNLDAERGLIGSVLLDNSLLSDLAAISPGEFWRDAHQVVWKGILELYRTGMPVDPLILNNWLELRGKPAGADFDLVDEICGKVPHAANGRAYAGIVVEKARMRGVIDAANRMLDDAYGQAISSDDVIDRAGEAIRSIGYGPAAGKRTRSLERVRLSSVEPEQITWLWPNRIPAGKVTLLIGDPGLGKSFLTLLITATVTRGLEWPDGRGRCEEGRVLLVQAEDGLADTVRPRLDWAGGDPEKVEAVQGITLPDRSLSTFSLARDIPALEDAVRELGDCKLIVIDPVSAYLGSKADSENSNAQIRGLLTPLKDLCERTGVAAIVVTHMNKGSGTKAIYRATGSLAFVAAARMAWFVCKDKADPTRRKLLSAKSNVVAEPSGLAYRLVQPGRVEFEAEAVHEIADEALEEEAQEKKEKKKRGRPSVRKPEAEQLVRTLLAYGPMTYSALRSEVEKRFSSDTYHQALNALRDDGAMEEYQVEGRRGKWFRLVNTLSQHIDSEDAPASGATF